MPLAWAFAGTAGLLLLLLVLSWARFDQGMHPVFLFLALLSLFQGGRLLAFCLPGLSFNPMSIDLATQPFDILQQQQRLALFALALSAVCIYLPSRLFNLRLQFRAPETGLVPYLLVIFLACFPFHVFKNYEYLMFVRSHGGYLAIFQSQEHLDQAGLAVRVLSQLCSASFFAYFAMERPRLRLWIVTAAYCSVSVVELLIGLRGKVLLTLLGLLFLAKMKRGTRFRPLGLISVALVVSVLAQAAAIFRESKRADTTILDAPQALLRSQGVSIGVLESAIAYRDQFSKHNLSYLAHNLTLAFNEQDPKNEPLGRVFDDDLSYFLNPSGFRLGFGTGGSYLAEAWLFAGFAGIVLESLAIASLLGWCARNFGGMALPFVWTLTVALLYLPRQDLGVALGGAAKGCIGIAFAMALSHFLRTGWQTIQRAYTPPGG